MNPIRMVNETDARKRVNRLRKARPEMTERQLCRIIIKKKTGWCALSGIVTALPGIIPGPGTLISLFGGTFLDIAALSYILSEMVMEIAIVYDRDLGKQGSSREALWVLLSSVGADTVSKNVTRLAAKQMGTQAFTKVANNLLISMGIRLSQRSLLKIIPLLGALISGTVNYLFCKKAGSIIADYYEKNRGDHWEGITIDV